MINKNFTIKELKELGLPNDDKLMKKSGVIVHLFEKNKYSHAEKAGNSEMDLIFSMPGDNKKWKVSYLIIDMVDIWNQKKELNLNATLMEEEIITTKKWKAVEEFDYSKDPLFLIDEIKRSQNNFNNGRDKLLSACSNFIEGILGTIPFILVEEYEDWEDNYIKISDFDSKKYGIGENDFVILYKSSKEMSLAKLTIDCGKLVAGAKYYR